MYWIIAYCVLVATGFTYCVIHDHVMERHGLGKPATTMHETAKPNRSGR